MSPLSSPRRGRPPQQPPTDPYIRLPQVLLDQANPRHMRLLAVMRERGFYRPEGAKKFVGYTELVRGFLFSYFGLSAFDLPPVGVVVTELAAELPAISGSRRIAPPETGDEDAVSATDDMATGYFAQLE